MNCRIPTSTKPAAPVTRIRIIAGNGRLLVTIVSMRTVDTRRLSGVRSAGGEHPAAIDEALHPHQCLTQAGTVQADTRRQVEVRTVRVADNASTVLGKESVLGVFQSCALMRAPIL